MRVKKYLALIFAAILATTMLTACPWDIEDDAASDSSGVPSSSSRPSHDGGSSDDNDNDDDSSSAPSSPSTPDGDGSIETDSVKVSKDGKLTVQSGVTELTAEDITAEMKAVITEVTLKDVTVEQGTFANCDKLETVNITGGTLNSGDEIDGPFKDCEKLETVTLDGVTIKGYGTFVGCESLHTVNLENNVNVANATSTFYLCRELTTVNGATMLDTIPPRMFAACSSLQYIDISGATSISDSAFSNCTSLTAVDANGATSIGQSAFAGCNNLTDIRVGTGLDNIGDNAFIKYDESYLNIIPMELTVHCKGSAEDVERLKEKFEASDVGNYAANYPIYKDGCNETCWSSIVSQSQTVVPEAGNALARHLLDLRL